MLHVENLCVNYGAIKAVRNVSFHVEKGEIVSIIGNNGAADTSVHLRYCRENPLRCAP